MKNWNFENTSRRIHKIKNKKILTDFCNEGVVFNVSKNKRWKQMNYKNIQDKRIEENQDKRMENFIDKSITKART